MQQNANYQESSVLKECIRVVIISGRKCPYFCEGINYIIFILTHIHTYTYIEEQFHPLSCSRTYLV